MGNLISNQNGVGIEEGNNLFDCRGDDFIGAGPGHKTLGAARSRSYQWIRCYIGFWRFDYVENHNIAFSIGHQLPNSIKQPLIIGVGIFALIFLIYFIIQSEKSFLVYTSTVLIMAGALGNLIDRLINGYVVDFIHWFYKGFDWPVFNLADAYITVGMILLITEFLFFAQQTSQNTNKALPNSEEKQVAS